MSSFPSIWPPILKNLKVNISADESLVLAFSPFIRSGALEEFLDTFPVKSARLVVRWKVEDLLAGASDLGIFDVLKERKIPLYQHSKIHLKLFEFSSGLAYSGSSNITDKGLSLSDSYNEEMGVLSPLDFNSYGHIRRLCDESRRVTKEVVEAYQRAIDESQVDPQFIGNLVLPPMEEKEFRVSDLPASESPRAFFDAVSSYLKGHEMCPQMLHDIGSLKLSESDLLKEDFEEISMQAFQSQLFVKRIVEKIRSRPSMNFGAVTAFVHENAQDVPLPYRFEIKDAIARLYPWLAYCFDDVSWSVPGAKSQVIRSSLYEE
ncbi:MAG: hypothetical protein ACSHYB_05210 [Roseibacillus sp.]